VDNRVRIKLIHLRASKKKENLGLGNNKPNTGLESQIWWIGEKKRVILRSIPQVEQVVKRKREIG
jgi:hypothetical protein